MLGQEMIHYGEDGYREYCNGCGTEPFSKKVGGRERV
jgi:hypothetical protein